jgi:capsular exopolysaccharide synthesis family protein
MARATYERVEETHTMMGRRKHEKAGQSGLGLLSLDLSGALLLKSEQVPMSPPDFSASDTSSPGTALMLRPVESPASRALREAIYTLRTHLLLQMEQGRRVIVVGSSRPQEGKSICTALLARAMCSLRRVLVVEADLRRPTVAALLGARPGDGVSDIAMGVTPASTIQEVGGLAIIPAGTVTTDPQRALASENFRAALASLRKDYDLILIDTPPVLACADALLVAPLSAGVILVGGAGQVSRSEATEARRRFNSVSTQIIGGILNKTLVNEADPYPFYPGEPAPGPAFFGHFATKAVEPR